MDKVFVYSTLTTAEMAGMREEGVRYWDDVDLAQPKIQGAATTAALAVLHGMNDLYADIKESEREVILDLHDGEEMLPTVLDQLLNERMGRVRWVDQKDNPANLDNPNLERRLQEYGDEKGQPYGRPRYVIHMEMPDPDKPQQFSSEGIVVVEEIEVATN